MLLSLLFCQNLHSFAQKLPNVQQSSVRAPPNIKIDGKLTEWDGQLQAFNHATDIFYTVSNDDNNLYLAIQATKPRVIEKIIDVGITFTVNKLGKKNDDAHESVTVSYPNIDVANGQRILINAGKKVKSDIPIPIRNGQSILPDTTDRLPTRTDSLVKIANALLTARAKTIAIKGLTDISEDSISVYNENKIYVAAKFDRDGNYTYELTIPLKYLHLEKDSKKFSYNIKLPGRLVHPKVGMNTRYIYPNGQMVDVDQDLDATTDFWAEYTIVAK